MLLGCIADDFTGASDIANTLSKAGMRSRLFFSPISGAAVSDPDDFDAAIVALKSRSIAPELAVEQSLHALRWLMASGARQTVFKYCSTFDSTPTGNIGPVAEALAKELGAEGVVVCPSFPENGRTVYQGHLFVGDQLLDECGMQDHPITPMKDADIRRWLQLQCTTPVGHVPYQTIVNGPQAILDALDAAARAGHRLVVTDAITDGDLLAIGKAVRNSPIITGGSAIAMGLPANFVRGDLWGSYSPNVGARCGPGLILSGSCSRMTMKQVEQYAAIRPSFSVDIAQLMEGGEVDKAALDFVSANLDNDPLVYSTGSAQVVRAMQERFGRERVSERAESFFGELARKALGLGLQRLVVAGGETSGAVVQALGLSSLDIGPEIAPGVPSLYSGASEAGAAFALKSGNFGDENFFADALRRLETGHD